MTQASRSPGICTMKTVKRSISAIVSTGEKRHRESSTIVGSAQMVRAI